MSVTNKPDYGAPLVEIDNKVGRGTPAFLQFLDSVVQQINSFRSRLMNWAGSWIPGDTYLRNDVVLDNGWTMIANKTTEERPSPQITGAPTSVAETAGTISFSTPTVVGQVFYTGNRYIFVVNEFVSAFRWYAPETSGDFSYEIWLAFVDLTTGVVQVEQLLGATVPNTVGWQNIPSARALHHDGRGDFLPSP